VDTKPIEVKIIPTELDGETIGRMVFVTLLSLAPVAIAILMQKPALRQGIVMNLSHHGKEFCGRQGEFWNGMSAKCAQVYNTARM
jgi:hypothetical protein